MRETEMEDLLWDYPELFLNEPLKQFRRQTSSAVGRADLIFTDRIDRLLIVEIKHGKLECGAISQLLDYFGMVKREFSTPGKYQKRSFVISQPRSAMHFNLRRLLQKDLELPKWGPRLKNGRSRKPK